MLGQTLRVYGDDAFVGANGFLLIGFPSPTPTPISGGRCSLYLDGGSMGILTVFGVQSPAWSQSLPLPNVQALADVLIAPQAVFGPTDAPRRTDASNAVYLNLGR